MKKINFTQAVTILSDFHTTELVINKVEKNGQVDTENKRINIKTCCAGAINALLAAGFTVSMDNGYLSVQDYCK